MIKYLLISKRIVNIFKLFRKVEDISTFEVKKFSPSSLITRTTNDITQIEFLIAMGLTLIIKAPITAVWAVTKILNKNIEWSILTGVAVLVLLITIGIIMMIVMPKFKIVQELIKLKRIEIFDPFPLACNE